MTPLVTDSPKFAELLPKVVFKIDDALSIEPFLPKNPDELPTKSIIVVARQTDISGNVAENASEVVLCAHSYLNTRLTEEEVMELAQDALYDIEHEASPKLLALFKNLPKHLYDQARDRIQIKLMVQAKHFKIQEIYQVLPTHEPTTP